MRGLSVALYCAWCAHGLSAAEPMAPNVVMIVSDDQAWSDYGFMGHPVVKTPNLDRLASRSLVFPRGYVAAPICRPSLASIVTGLLPSQHGITSNDVDGPNNRAALDVGARQNFYTHATLARLLTSHGYLTHQSGKWWEGSYREGGFTHGMTHGDPKRGARHGDAGLAIGREGLRPIGAFVDEAIAQQKPFFLWYAPLLPHAPHNAPKRLRDKYAASGCAADVADYYAACEWFDETCGELLEALGAKGVLNNTLVLYVCDNGWAAPSTNAQDPKQKAWPQYALRSKGSPYENGIRTPIMIAWPDRVEPGSTDALAHAVDLLPTVASAVGIDTPAGLPGINLLDAQARNARQRVFGECHSTHNMNVGSPEDTEQYLWCVEDQWKLIVRSSGSDPTRYRALHAWDNAPARLYAIKDDPQELHDVASSHPAVVERLRIAIDDWRQRIHAPEQGVWKPTLSQKLVYKDTPDGRLRLHVFNPEGHSPTDRRPAIVFFFGGGWVSGAPTQFYPHCQHLASRGMVAMSAEYRVNRKHGATPDVCVKDGKSAIRWVRGHALEMGIDPEKILAGGGSAGGQVAAACGSVDAFDDERDNLAVSARPAALVLFNPVVDNGPDGYGHNRVKDYWREFSPLHNISRTTPPTAVFLGDKDDLVPVATAREYQRLMAESGVRCDLHLYQGQPHGFFNVSNQNYYAATVAEMDRFLASLGYLSDAATLMSH